MNLKNFRGGVHPEYNKHITSDKPIKVLPAPKEVVIPLAQHAGAPAEPLVKKGDSVLLGQEIGSSAEPISAAVHTSVSGTVLAVEPRPSINGREVLSVVIENDGQDAKAPMTGHDDPIQLPREEIRKRIEAAGIVGLGGAAFPTAAKLSPPRGCKIEYLLINGSECEPYLTADQKLMEEYTEDVVLGAKLLAKACGAEKTIIAIEANKPEALRKMKALAGSNAIEVVALAVKYPAGGEKQLIKAVLNREVPAHGLPAQCGALVHNVGTAWAAAKACRHGQPLIERVITVTGDGVKAPANYLVRIGTPFRDIIAAAGGFAGEPGKVIAGGPMMGLAQFDLNVPIVKGVSGILVLSDKVANEFDPMPCIKCARCVDVCPVYLMPVTIEKYAMNAMWDEAEDYGAMDCIECGCCTYICPSKRALLSWIRLAKTEIVEAHSRHSS
ncbi:MAG TPA: electron transport complex subunit RsxC [Limnochordia bacterium]|nr:electron transport complex subunit RsxC [Bacillota bacterium]HKM17193.1 electron transport complex subunit RsxC [Limnochordia bacterium]